MRNTNKNTSQMGRQETGILVTIKEMGLRHAESQIAPERKIETPLNGDNTISVDNSYA
ncbi:hypothetical protein C1G86_1570 [Dehalococcoides mccartyi]|uniref:Uncharacterized protein n=1 Tax=Dehalococcoides mccartyi TaxID=61435 RepID=A0A328EJX5_9CHLR|nr:hypothetical protein C1G87_1604 [Dehalococcoides mccartyi]RAL70043.1 hypothetical protein C1G86_1570 [Dehalococcoides mccartyi]